MKQWAAEMLLALEALHQQGVLCRDLNPQNLLLDQGGKNPSLPAPTPVFGWEPRVNKNPQDYKATCCSPSPSFIYSFREDMNLGWGWGNFRATPGPWTARGHPLRETLPGMTFSP